MFSVIGSGARRSISSQASCALAESIENTSAARENDCAAARARACIIAPLQASRSSIWILASYITSGVLAPSISPQPVT